MSLLSLIIDLNVLLILINATLYLQRYRTFKTSLKVFTIYLLLIGIIQLITRILSVLVIDNLFLSHYYFVIQFIFLSMMYRKIIDKQILKNIIGIIFIVVLVFLASEYILNPSKYFKFNLNEILVTTVPLIFYSFIFFIQSLNSNNKSLIYINSGIFVYLLCSTLIFSSGNLMPDLDPKINKIIWSANALLYMIYQSLVFIDWYKNFRNPKLST